MQRALAAVQIAARSQTTTTDYQPTSPPMTTSPPRTAPSAMPWLMECGTTPAVMGNSTGLVFTMRITLPAPGVSRMQKNGRSHPSSVYNSITCLLLFGPWSSSIRALSGRPSVFRNTWTLSTSESKGYVRSADPWIGEAESTQSGDGSSTASAMTLASMGNSSCPKLRTEIVLSMRGVLITQLKGRRAPFSLYTRIFTGVLSGPCQSCTSASSGRPSVVSTTCTCSTYWDRYVQVRREPP